MKIIKLNYDISEYTPSKYEGEGQITIEIGDRVKYYNASKWVTGKWLQGFSVSFFRSDIEHPGSGSNKYISHDNISAIQKEGQGEWMPVQWHNDKYIVLPKTNLTGGNKMKIRKIAQNASQNLIRFDKDARVEIFIDEYDIRTNVETNIQYDELISRKDITDEQKIVIIKNLCVEMATERLKTIEASFGIQVTVDGLSIQDINIDRIRWDKILHPEII